MELYAGMVDNLDFNIGRLIQYLKDIAGYPDFKQIILTHNFDFFRTMQSRFVKYKHCLMALKSNNGISLEQAIGSSLMLPLVITSGRPTRSSSSW